MPLFKTRYPKTKLDFESSSEEISSDIQSATQALMEAAKWKAKYEILKENLAYERKERKKAETNLNKLAYELGTVRGEVKLLEQRIKALTSGAEMPEKAPAAVQEKVPEAKIQKEPVRETAPMPEMAFGGVVATEVVAKSPILETFAVQEKNEEPKLFISVHQITPNIKPTAVLSEQPAQQFQPAIDSEIIEETKPVVVDPVKNDELLFYLTESYKMESANLWEIGKEILDMAHSSPKDLYHDIVTNKGTQEGMYQMFLTGLENLYKDYGSYRQLAPHIHDDLENLDRVLPYVKHIFSQSILL